MLGPRTSRYYELDQTLLRGGLSSLIDNALYKKGSGPARLQSYNLPPVETSILLTVNTISIDDGLLWYSVTSTFPSLSWTLYVEWLKLTLDARKNQILVIFSYMKTWHMIHHKHVIKYSLVVSTIVMVALLGLPRLTLRGSELLIIVSVKDSLLSSILSLLIITFNATLFFQQGMWYHMVPNYNQHPL